jgi:hypothetical protein
LLSAARTFLAVTAAFVATWAAGGGAYAEGWSIRAAKGTALRLNGDAWEEIVIGEGVIDGGIYRTLRSGTIVLEGEGALIRLGGRTAIGIDLTPLGASILQYAGQVTIAAPDHAGSPVRVRNTAVRASGTATTFTVFFDGATGRVEVDTGMARVANVRTGAEFMLEAGSELSTSPEGEGKPVARRPAWAWGSNRNGSLLSGNGGSARNGNSSGLGTANEDGSGNGNGSGSGSGGGNGNGNGNGSGGANGNGSDNGNGSGNGDGNSNGNGNR